MLNVKLITVGNLKENYLRTAFSEYEKRLSNFCRFENIELKEAKIKENPSQAEIDAALSDEGKRILACVPPKAFRIALCVEGKQLSSPELAEKIEKISLSTNEICFIIGSSHGLSDEVKKTADFKLSVSLLTFPHQLMRVMMLEIIYRAFNIIKGTKYHK